MSDFSIILNESGLSLVARVYNQAGTQQGADVTMTESGSTGVYTGTYSEASLAAGTYDEFPVSFVAGGENVGRGVLKVENGAEVTDRYLQDIRDDVAALNNLSAAQVNAEVDTALADYDAPTRAELTTDINSVIAEVNANEAKIDIVDSNVDSVVAKLPAGTISDFDESANQVTVATNNDKTDYGLSASERTTLTGVIWNALTSGFTLAGSIGKRIVDNLNATVSSRATASGVWANATRTITGGTITTNSDKSGYSISGTLTTLDALDTAQDSQHATTQAAITALNDLSTADIDARLAAYDAPTLAEMTAAFTEIKGAGWTTTDTLEAIREAVGAISSLSAADVNAQVDIALADYDGPTNAELTAARDVITAAISALNDLSLAQVEGSTVLAKEATLSAKSSQSSVDVIDGLIDAIKATVDLNLDEKVSAAKQAADDAPFI